jgi:hypothetical protein
LVSVLRQLFGWPVTYSKSAFSNYAVYTNRKPATMPIRP